MMAYKYKNPNNPHGHDFIDGDGDIILSKVPSSRRTSGKAIIIDTSPETGMAKLMDALR